MTTVTRLRGRVPADTFAVRLAIVRAEMGWNYDQSEAVTGIKSETWRLWEKRRRRCTTLEETCRKIADATGFAYEWLMVGGPLADPNPFNDPGQQGPRTSDDTAKTNSGLLHDAGILDPWLARSAEDATAA